MPAPTAAFIARIGAQYTALSMPETAVVQRVTHTANDSGGWTDTTATVLTTVARVAPAGAPGFSAGLRASGRLEDIDLWLLTFPAGTDVQAGDVVLINSRTFNVNGPDGARSDEITRRVTATEVT